MIPDEQINVLQDKRQHDIKRATLKQQGQNETGETISKQIY